MRVFTQRLSVTDYRRRTAALLALATLGVILAWAGTAVGLGSVVAGGEPTGRVSIAGDDVTVAGERGQPTVVENLSETEAVEVSVTDGQITVVTDERGPLTDDQRERARELARDYVTAYASLERPVEFTVEPVRKMTAGASERYEVDSRNWTTEDGATFTVESHGSVTVTRGEHSVRVEPTGTDATYVEDRAAVRITDRETGELRYTVEVNLANGTVVDITDWQGD